MSRPTIPAQDFEEATAFLHKYAQSHYRFTGGDVLEAWRATHHPGAFHNWRNVWSNVLSHGQKAGWFIKVGRLPTTSKQSHTATLAMWQSKLFKPVGITPTVSPARHLDGIREKILTGKCSMREGLIAAYTYGIEQHGKPL
jgi:hypothetical protein